MPADAPAATPLLSVVIPVRDRPEALAALIARLGEQGAARMAAGEVETIVCDDASSPPAAAPDLPNARLLRSDRPLGANRARGMGLAAARGRFVHFHDSDDGLEDGWLDAVLRRLAALDDAPRVLVTRRTDVIDGRPVPVRQDYFEAQAGRPDRVRRILPLRNCLGPYGGVIFSRAALDGLALPDAASSQDWLLFLDVMERRPALEAIPEAAFIFRRDGTDRISGDPRRRVRGMFAVMRRTREATFLGSALRLYHLHRFRREVRALGRADLARILRRSAPARHAVHALALAYMVATLRLR